MHIACGNLYQLLLILAVACVAGCHLPHRSPSTQTVLAAAGVILAIIGAIVALVC